MKSPLLPGDSETLKKNAGLRNGLGFFLLLTALGSFAFLRTQKDQSESRVGAVPNIELGTLFKVEFPKAGDLPTGFAMPENYAKISNPWQTQSMEAMYASPPFYGLLTQHVVFARIVSDPEYIGGSSQKQTSRTSYFCTSPNSLGHVFILKALSEWKAPEKEPPDDWNTMVEDIIMEYEEQTLLSYFSFFYSSSDTFKRSALESLNYGPNGRFAVAQPIFVKITDPDSSMYTFALVYHAFGNSFKHQSTVTSIHLKRNQHFVEWVENIVGSDHWPEIQGLPPFSLRPIMLTGFWQHRDTTFMKDGRLMLLARDPSSADSGDLTTRRAVLGSMAVLVKFFRKRGIARSPTRHPTRFPTVSLGDSAASSSQQHISKPVRRSPRRAPSASPTHMGEPSVPQSPRVPPINVNTDPTPFEASQMLQQEKEERRKRERNNNKGGASKGAKHERTTKGSKQIVNF